MKMIFRSIPKGATKVTDKFSDAVAYIFSRQDRPYAVVYFGNQTVPVIYERYSTPQRREARVKQAFEGRRSAVADKAQRQADRVAKNAAARKAVQIGDVYRTCWGYDQTNVEFFEVTEVKGAYAVLREIAAASEDNGHGTEKCVAQSGQFLEPRYDGDDRGKPIRRLIQDGHIKIDDIRTAWPWGKRVAGVVVGSPASRTAFGWGH